MIRRNNSFFSFVYFLLGFFWSHFLSLLLFAFGPNRQDVFRLWERMLSGRLVKRVSQDVTIFSLVCRFGVYG